MSTCVQLLLDPTIDPIIFHPHSMFGRWATVPQTMLEVPPVTWKWKMHLFNIWFPLCCSLVLACACNRFGFFATTPIKWYSWFDIVASSSKCHHWHLCVNVGSNMYKFVFSILFVPKFWSFSGHLSVFSQALGPAFVKLGQAAACREDILSEAVARELRKLCDQVARRGFFWSGTLFGAENSGFSTNHGETW